MSQSRNRPYEINVIVLGDEQSGKTSLVKKFVYENYILDAHEYEATVGVGFLPKTLIANKLKLNLYDTAGDRANSGSDRAIARFHAQANIVILTFDLSNRASFEKAQALYEHYHREDDGKVYALVGTKSDLVNQDPSQRQVSENEAQEWAVAHDMKYFEASATDAKTINNPFIAITKECLEKKGEHELVALLDGQTETMDARQELADENRGIFSRLKSALSYLWRVIVAVVRFFYPARAITAIAAIPHAIYSARGTADTKNEVFVSKPIEKESKIVIIGAVGIGKTQLIARWVNDEYAEEYKKTDGATYWVKRVKSTDASGIDTVLKLNLWDVAGDTKDDASVLFDANVVILAFSVKNKESFEEIKAKYAEKKLQHPDKQYVLVGLQADQDLAEDERKVSEDDARDFADDNDLPYMELSTKKDGAGVEKLFAKIIKNFCLDEAIDQDKTRENKP